MSSEPVVKLEQAGKAYALFSKPEDRLKQMVFGRHRTFFQEFWALQPTDLEISPGETWGIIGRNGSGKSTMLQMICGNLTPTTGRITVRGRVAALLELGAGFNPEFTGRENVYINGALAGYRRDEIDARMDEILAFADIGAFVDQPVKTYSSGMFARLAFAVAINVEPDILVVDEALAVGDEAFQRKCFARMEQIKSNGTTILMVSHSVATINQLCDWAVLLHRGAHVYTGRPKWTVAWYQKLSAAPDVAEAAVLQSIRAKIAEEKSEEVDPLQTAPEISNAEALPPSTTKVSDMVLRAGESQEHGAVESRWDPNFISKSTVTFPENGALISSIRIETLSRQQVNCLITRRKYNFCYRVKLTKKLSVVEFHFGIRTISGISLGGGICRQSQNQESGTVRDADHEIKFQFDCRLIPGTYFLNCGVTGDGEVLHRVVDAIIFRVDPDGLSQAFGLVDFGVKGQISQVAADT